MSILTKKRLAEVQRTIVILSSLVIYKKTSSWKTVEIGKQDRSAEERYEMDDR